MGTLLSHLGEVKTTGLAGGLDYFEISPRQFFDTESRHPELVQKAVDGMKQLNERDQLMLLGLINRMLEK